MSKAGWNAGMGLALSLALVGPAHALFNKKEPPPELRKCASPVGTVAIDEPQHQWWVQMGLGNPEALIKMMAMRSGCLRVVDRQRALAMRGQERELADSGELRRQSNVGKGQVVAADYAIVPDIVAQDANAGGNAVGGALGGLVGGRVGGLLGGLKTKRLEAQTLITLVDMRTTEQVYVAEGSVKKTDMSFGAGGFLGFGAAVGGGYDDTEIGKVVSAAYLIAFNDLVGHMQNMNGDASQAAGIQAYTVTEGIVLHGSPSAKGATVRKFKPGDLVYPTGNKEGVWWEVEDENGNSGWVSSDTISARGQ